MVVIINDNENFLKGANILGNNESPYIYKSHLKLANYNSLMRKTSRVVGWKKIRHTFS